MPELTNLGPASRQMLSEIGLQTDRQILESDPIACYKLLRQAGHPVSLNLIYAILGAQQGISWQQVQKLQKAHIMAKLQELD